MSDERKYDEIDALIRDLARDYNAPPATPSEAMWERIARQRGAEAEDAGRPRRWWSRAWVWMPAAAVVVLALGVGIGRDTLRQDAERALVAQREAHDREQTELLYRLAATPVLSRGEQLLTEYRSASVDAPRAAELSDWAGALLLETRLLLDSPAADDPELEQLLEDLELFLAQIRRGTGDAEERAIINEGLRERALLARLRDRIPAGNSPSGA